MALDVTDKANDSAASNMPPSASIVLFMAAVLLLACVWQFRKSTENRPVPWVYLVFGIVAVWSVLLVAVGWIP